MRLLLALLISVPILVAVSGATSADKRQIYGLGLGIRTSCGQYVAANEGQKLNTYHDIQQNGVRYVSENEAMNEWALGVLTEVNVARDSGHQIQNDNAAIELWLRNWCTKHPTSTLFDAVDGFAVETPGIPIK